MRLKLALRYLLPVLLLCAQAWAAEVDPAAFHKRVYQDAAGKTLPYRLFVPKDYDPARKYPLVLFLHGAGERGTDTDRLFVHKSCFGWATPESQAKNPCFVVAPQCPENDQWTRVENWSVPVYRQPDAPTEALRLVMELVPALQKEFSLDPNRLYATGLSMGGYGTWELLSRRPGLFAAAVPICGGVDETKAAVLARTPVWIFHGAKDGVVLPVHSRRIAAELRKAGGVVRYTEYPEAGHNSWDPAYAEKELPDWLFAQVKPASSAQFRQVARIQGALHSRSDE